MAGISKPRVYFINRFFHPDFSATSQILQGIASGLSARGYDVHVVASRQLYEQADADLPPVEHVHGVCVHRVTTSRFGRGRSGGRLADYTTFHGAAARCLWHRAGEGDVIVAKTDPPLLSVWAAHLARRRGAHLVNWLQDLFPEVAMASAFGGRISKAPLTALRHLRNKSLHNASQNVVIGERMQDMLLSAGVPHAKITLIPNWADPETIQPVPDSCLRESWGLNGKFVVGYSGNLGRVHDVSTMIDAIATLDRQHDDPIAASIAFVFIGGGAMKTLLEREIAARALKNVTLLPYQPTERLSESLAAADLHLVSLRPEFEGFVVPSKMYGIMAAARPAVFVGDEDGELARCIRRYRCGASAPSGAPALLANLIREFASNPERCAAMGAAARAAFDQSYTKLGSVSRWDEMLASLSTPTQVRALPAASVALR